MQIEGSFPKEPLLTEFKKSYLSKTSFSKKIE